MSDFFAFRERSMPVQSQLYELLNSIHSEQKKRFNKKYKSKLNKTLPITTVRYYNKVFAKTSRYITPILKKANIPTQFKSRAIYVFDFQLNKKSTLLDILSSDAFFGQTPNQDFQVDELLKGTCHDFTNSNHFSFHRAQQTEFLFFHEVIVGHLVNSASKNPRYLKRSELSIQSDYFHMSTYVFNMFCQLLKTTPETLIGYHVCDTHYLKIKLPVQFQEFIHISTHLSWYLEVINYYIIQAPTAEILSMLYTHFIIPALENLLNKPRLKIAKRAHQVIDQKVFETFFLGEKKTEPNQHDLLMLLTQLQDSIWARRV